MSSFISKDKCTGCTACENICPQKCIQMIHDKAGFEFPELKDPSKCISCGACERVCPVRINTNNNDRVSTSAYAAFSKNDSLRMKSSSGGIFTELATVVLQSGGIIYGAIYDEENKVRHIGIENRQDLDKLRGAKYSQSILADNYILIKKQLNLGRNVLFSGTPCQVAGLKAFLGKDYDNLVCIDFVCHGVPSPMVWEKYLQYRARKDNKGIYPEYINLRNKDSGWSNYTYSVEFGYADNKRYLCKNGEDPFMHLFVNDYILRDSCSDCHFKGYNRISDITLGDFWGIWAIYPDMDDNKGTSLLLIHSEKGKTLFNKIAEEIIYKQVELEEASRYNHSLLDSVEHKTNKDIVMDLACKGDFSIAKKIMNEQHQNNGFKVLYKLYKRIRNKIVRFIKR